MGNLTMETGENCSKWAPGAHQYKVETGENCIIGPLVHTNKVILKWKLVKITVIGPLVHTNKVILKWKLMKITVIGPLVHTNRVILPSEGCYKRLISQESHLLVNRQAYMSYSVAHYTRTYSSQYQAYSICSW